MRTSKFSYFVRCVPASVFIVALGCGPTLSHYRDAAHPATRKAAVVTSVCAITANPHSFDNRRVTVNACVAADDFEYRFLFDAHSECRGPGLVPLDTSAEVSTILKNGACGTFTGIFHWDPHPFVVYQTHVLYVETVTSVRRSR
jgi:hypothetical protein